MDGQRLVSVASLIRKGEKKRPTELSHLSFVEAEPQMARLQMLRSIPEDVCTCILWMKRNLFNTTGLKISLKQIVILTLNGRELLEPWHLTCTLMTELERRAVYMQGHCTGLSAGTLVEDVSCLLSLSAALEPSLRQRIGMRINRDRLFEECSMNTQ